jgi:DNA-binding CsgD family transcriptional regulator
MEASTLRERLAVQLRAAGLPVPRRTRSAIAADGLTDTERAVATEVVAGRSNKEVAESMSVSVRTVEVHLANIYRKTGATGRAGLARWWHR